MRNKIVIYGMGQLYKRYEVIINKTEVLCYVDVNVTESLYENKPVIKPEKLQQIEYDYIVVFTIKNFEEISYDLIWNYGVDINKIVIFQWYYNLNYNTKLIYNSIMSLIEKSNLKYILNVNDFIAKLGLWAICKDSNFIVDDICSDEYIYDVALIDGAGLNEKRINNMINNFSGKTKAVLIHVNGRELLNKQAYNIINIQGYIFLYVIFEKKAVKIYQVSHKPFIKYGNDIYVELGVGKYGKKGKLTDKNGDNIAYLNDKVNEITGLYEVWKNEHSAIVGINHYRRCFKSIVNPAYGALSELELYFLLKKYDVIVACSTGGDTYSEKDDLRNSINDEAFDRCWNKLNEYFNKKNIAEQQALLAVFNGQIMFPCNMIITSREIFNEYCDWLMPIVIYLVENIVFDVSWDTYSKRVIGFFAERLLTVWLYMKKYSIVEIPIQFIGEEGEYGK